MVSRWLGLVIFEDSEVFNADDFDLFLDMDFVDCMAIPSNKYST